MPCDNNASHNNSCLLDSLCDNLNSIVTCYTCGCCFTGLLVAITCDCIKLVTRNSTRSCSCNPYGKITVIPICEIQAVTFCNANM